MTTTHQINDGGPAFPQSVPAGIIGPDCGPHTEWGMSLRDWFAGQALQGIVSNADLSRHLISKTIGQVETGHDKIAAHAYAFADAMLAARNTKPSA